MSIIITLRLTCKISRKVDGSSRRPTLKRDECYIRAGWSESYFAVREAPWKVHSLSPSSELVPAAFHHLNAPSLPTQWAWQYAG